MGPEELSQLWANIRIFKIKAVDVLGDIHASRMSSIKWHLLDHVCD